MKALVLSFAGRGGAAWNAGEDRALLRAVKTWRLDPRDLRTNARTRRGRDGRWRFIARALGRTERAVRTRFFVLRLAARLCGCKKKRRRS